MYRFNKKIKSGEGQLVAMKIITHTDEMARLWWNQPMLY